MKSERSFRFTHAISRLPGNSVAKGIRVSGKSDPDPEVFSKQHKSYIQALATAGVEPIVLPKLEEFPDSVFVEDAALCFDGSVVLLRPGAESRIGEAAALEPYLQETFDSVIKFQGTGRVDGGDILLTDSHALIGLSERTDIDGINGIKSALEAHGYGIRIVKTPAGVLHFKSDCGLLDSKTIFSTKRLASSGCFDGYTVIEVPDHEEAAANLIRVNDYVILRSGFPKSTALLEQRGYETITVGVDEAAKIDGGLSCLSLRFTLNQ
jgi:dimethylargininase